jgi:hypothetical protein
MNPFCQIEYVSSDSDTGMPCGKPAEPGALIADLRSVSTVGWSVAAIHSVNRAMTTTP